MIPALEIIGALAQSPMGRQWITPSTLYWGTGLFSSILDNAPTYLNFVAASMASQGANMAIVNHVQDYAAGTIYPNSLMHLQAVSIAAVFFGAMTYIGNGPNFMIKAIAEQEGVAMPSFWPVHCTFFYPLFIASPLAYLAVLFLLRLSLLPCHNRLPTKQLMQK